MKNETTPNGVLTCSKDYIAKNGMALPYKDGMRLELPYLGLRSLQQLRYMDIAGKVRITKLGKEAGSVRKDIMAHVWKTIVQVIFWYEDSGLKQEKCLEVSSLPRVQLVDG